MTTTAVYADIVKHERDANGDLLVFGRATGPDLDLDRQICDPEWLKTAMPAWFQVGNLREQHSSIAAGVGQEITQLPDGGWNLKGLVVDPVSARKVETGVLKGYSIGIRSPKVVKDAAAPGGRIVAGDIVEISLVDRPANPSCTLTLAKAAKPGATVRPTDLDRDRMLVKVEELHDRSAEPLAALQALSVDLGKGDPRTQERDIAGAQQAIATIAQLVQAEAQQMADGCPSEACDIELLLSAVRALEWFIQRERESTMAHVELSDTPDAAKGDDVAKAADPQTAGKAAEAVTEKSDEPAAEKTAPAETPDLTELVKAAVAEAVAPLKAEMAKAMEQPAPGGPVLTRTTEDSTKAAKRELDLAKAAEYERLAGDIVGDPPTRQAYLNKAASLRGATS